MAILRLSNEERQVAAEVLQNYIAELRMEVGATDDFEFKESLKKKEAVLNAVIDKLGRPKPEAETGR